MIQCSSNLIYVLESQGCPELNQTTQTKNSIKLEILFIHYSVQLLDLLANRGDIFGELSRDKC